MDTKKLSKLSLKDFIKDNTAGSRLQSLRLPRDLSLGGTKLPKKVYKPNLNVVRNKDKGKEILKRNDQKTRAARERPDRSQDKQKGRFVQSTGVFSEGVGDAVRHIEKRASYVRDKDQNHERPPTVKKDCWAAVDKKLESHVFEGIIKSEFDSDSDEKDEKLPFVPINWCASDLQDIPIKNEIKVEPGSTVSEMETCFNVLPQEYSDNQQSTNSDTTLGLWQLPDSFGFKNIVDNVKNKKYIDCKLTDLPEGKIGKICVRKSGKIDVYIGDLKYELESAEFESFTEELVALDVKKPPQDSTAAVLGQIKSRYQLNPDWTTLLC